MMNLCSAKAGYDRSYLIRRGAGLRLRLIDLDPVTLKSEPLTAVHKSYCGLQRSHGRLLPAMRGHTDTWPCLLVYLWCTPDRQWASRWECKCLTLQSALHTSAGYELLGIFRWLYPDNTAWIVETQSSHWLQAGAMWTTLAFIYPLHAQPHRTEMSLIICSLTHQSMKYFQHLDCWTCWVVNCAAHLLHKTSNYSLSWISTSLSRLIFYKWFGCIYEHISTKSFL